MKLKNSIGDRENSGLKIYPKTLKVWTSLNLFEFLFQNVSQDIFGGGGGEKNPSFSIILIIIKVIPIHCTKIREEKLQKTGEKKIKKKIKITCNLFILW